MTKDEVISQYQKEINKDRLLLKDEGSPNLYLLGRTYRAELGQCFCFDVITLHKSPQPSIKPSDLVPFEPGLLFELTGMFEGYDNPDIEENAISRSRLLRANIADYDSVFGFKLHGKDTEATIKYLREVVSGKAKEEDMGISIQLDSERANIYTHFGAFNNQLFNTTTKKRINNYGLSLDWLYPIGEKPDIGTSECCYIGPELFFQIPQVKRLIEYLETEHIHWWGYKYPCRLQDRDTQGDRCRICTMEEAKWRGIVITREGTKIADLLCCNACGMYFYDPKTGLCEDRESPLEPPEGALSLEFDWWLKSQRGKSNENE